jgi:ABC-type transport system involved in multi-copper enzyme maturation permease subunit
MTFFHTIRTIAKYEMRTLLRSWFFRIFAALSIISLGIFNVAAFIPSSDAPFIFRAIPGAIPYANLIILNLGQAIVAVFLASEFLKQDSKNDSVEVIYARSMTNSEYIIGKTLGIISLFLFLNFIILLMGMGFSFLSNDSSIPVLELLYYPLLISLPTLVFILGLSFFLMITLKNQAITFIVLLGYIALTIFYLNTEYYHIFDYIAYQVPLMNSTIGGFGNLQEVLIHRGIYFFLGIGLILFTIFRLNRLPQAKYLVKLPLFLAILSIAGGGFLANHYIGLKTEAKEAGKRIIALNDKYVNYPKANMFSCDLDLKHVNDEIDVKAKLTLLNKSKTKIDTLIFSLNPSLEVSHIGLNKGNSQYIRENHILKIPLKKSLNKNEECEIQINYKGTIDEKVHFLDRDQETYSDNFSAALYRIRKRYSYLQNDFVCLTRDALWYPVCGVTYNTLNPAFRDVDFTHFSLKVKSENQLIPVSQGKLIGTDNGTYQFKSESPLTQISLLLGQYNKHSITVDSVEYSLYTQNKNQYYLEHFTAVKDSLPSLIRELKNEYETQLGLSYPFKNFKLAEVPIQFALDKHVWSSSSDAVQPQIIFYPEKGVLMEDTDFKRRKVKFEKRMKRNKEEVTEEDLQSRIFKRFVRSNFTTEVGRFEFDIVDKNTYSPFPNYYNFASRLATPEYAALNIAMGSYLKNQDGSAHSQSRWQFEGISKDERINLEFKDASLEELIKTGIKNQSDSEREIITLYDIFQTKGNHLFSLFSGDFGKKEFNNFLIKFINEHQNQNYTFHELDSAIQEKFGTSIDEKVKTWYSQKKLPGFLVKDLETFKVKQGDHIKYQVKFKISNPEPTDGIVSVQIEESNANQRSRGRRFWQENNEPSFSKVYHIPAKSAKEIGLVFTAEPSRMNIYTHISQNLPNNLVYDFESFNKTKRTKFFNEIKSCEFFDNTVDKNEFIVDNEDVNFTFEQTSNKSRLKQWVDSRREKTHNYTNIRWWNPPNEWKNVLRSAFYGKYVKSAYFTKSGQGDRTATWTPKLKESNYYDVYCHINKYHRRRRNARKADYNFKIYHEGGVENVHKSDQELENGWNFLGTYYINPDDAKVELSNKSVGNFIFADAIKWVKNE